MFFKQGDEISYSIATCPPNPGINCQGIEYYREYEKAFELYLSKGESVIGYSDNRIVYNGIIADLTRFFLPVSLPGGVVKSIPYDSLTFFGDNEASFKSKLADWKGIDPETHKEVLIPGREVTLYGWIDAFRLADLHIPVLIEGDLRQIVYKNLTFKEI